RLVMGVILFRPLDDLAVERVLHPPLDQDDHGLVGLVGHHGAGHDALGHRYTPQACALAARARSFCTVLMRAMARRTSRTRDGFPIWFVAAWKRRLNCSRFSSISRSLSWSSVSFWISSNLAMSGVLKQGFAKAGDHLGLDRQLLR